MIKRVLNSTLSFIGVIALLTVVNSCEKDGGSNNRSNTTITDVDGNIYNTITIGTQIWMVENLCTTKYNDSTDIPNVTDNSLWAELTTGAYCNSDNDESNSNTYGRLYNWYAVQTGKLAPKGWHVPTKYDWSILTTYLGGENVAGGKLKERGTIHWSNPNTGATNTSGFTALPGGYRYNFGAFATAGQNGFFWSSTENSIQSAWGFHLGFNYSIIGLGGPDANTCGFSVRCLKD